MKLSKIAIITGAAGGIGTALVEAFVQQRYTVYAFDIVKVDFEGAHFIYCDVTDENAFKSAIAEICTRHNRLDVFINNAGADGEQKPIWESSSDNWHQIMKLNLDATYYGMKYASAFMKNQQHGLILNVSSVCGIKAVRNIQPYSASKAAMNMLTKTVALELAPFKVNVNAICPSVVHTALLEHFIQQSPSPDERRKSFENFNPRPGKISADEVAQLALYLASEAAISITGQCIALDGGYTL